MATHGPLYRLLEEDHRRLESLLAQTRREMEDSAPLTMYDEFRKGLLRHISIEEKVLIPAVQRVRGAAVQSVAERLRLDHGAIAALLVPPPSPMIIRALFGILDKHNVIEEGTEGFYEVCETLPEEEQQRLMQDVHSARQIPLSPNINNPNALDATRRALARAGYTLDDYA
ncbi:MAG: hemerythrin domain-containing protein [Acidobacteriota bacterium]